jgi:hypothetical protein
MSTPRKIYRLVLTTILIAGVWLLVLPWLARRPAIGAYLRWLDERQIDPSAMYYTEVDAMKPILRRLNERERRGCKL